MGRHVRLHGGLQGCLHDRVTEGDCMTADANLAAGVKDYRRDCWYDGMGLYDSKCLYGCR